MAGVTPQDCRPQEKRGTGHRRTRRDEPWTRPGVGGASGTGPATRGSRATRGSHATRGSDSSLQGWEGRDVCSRFGVCGTVLLSRVTDTGVSELLSGCQRRGEQFPSYLCSLFLIHCYDSYKHN